MGPSRDREKKALREARERNTEAKGRSEIMKGPEGHCKDHSFTLTETSCWKVLREAGYALT